MEIRSVTVPVLHVYLFEGRTEEQKALLMKALTDAVVTTLGSPTGNVRIMIQELQKEDYAVGGVSVKAMGR
ncbi:2-hydroxymuconate tautomerase [Noviherbaspirillum sp. Root189]|uniref:2-hydroxymuconate tautomerase n=1 Tax=Noviherbaspirillum sp. Root189 TaxID=1736487 RepID=UPI001F356EC3|nr:2-hydroxymuconate tautomerase [Noviherbaspirillum sp. Root189]